MKSTLPIERDGYVICSIQDSIFETKIINDIRVIGSGDRVLLFGEVQIYEEVKCEGEINILTGTPILNEISTNVTKDTEIYGTIEITSEVSLNAVLTVI